ncbi:hypothetical protein GCM10025868_18980 [Angustibacter aerolatus]|uniref:NADP-dependent oxidoreductase domain-containing protein n=1 Tax=Angustibacter aerolatus TaxID=1162965 RepID=A0ABQ6JEM9_9ACTN|nr:aldo/keto reductase [Angustibacter aerolatus]GMA86648.1 hypothetical protein GCM10025868_18980 [Angustibacter aerolatus]
MPAAEQFGEIKSFVDEGLALQIGLSEVTVDDVRAAREAGLDVVSVQNRYNLGDRSAEEPARPLHRRGHRVHPVGAGGRRGAGPAGRPARRGVAPARGRHHLAGGAGLAAAPLAGDRADPGHVVRRAPGGEPRRGRRRA